MTNWFFAAGSGAYDELPPLHGVSSDLKRMNGLFEEQLDYRVAPELLDRSADALRRELGGGPQQSFGADDTVVVYYGGHGDRCGGRHYLQCADTMEAAPAATALATEDLVRLLAERGARRLLLVIDTCKAADGGAEAVRNVARTVLGEFGQRPESYVDQQLVSFSVLCASRAYEAAHGSAFAEALEAAVRDEACGGPRAKKLLLETLVDHVNGRLGNRQHATHATFLSEGGEHAFFPNPHRLKNDVPEGVSLAEQRLQAENVHAGTGFVGRADALATLDALVCATDPPGRLLTIAGASGTGKSALLREVLRHAEEREAGTGTDGRMTTLLADVRHRDLDYLVTRLTETVRTEPFLLLVDGVEEAGQEGDDQPREIARFLNERAARWTGLRVVATVSKQLAAETGAGADVDLDQRDPEDDLVTLAERLLTEPDGPGSRSDWSAERAREAAPRVVRMARGSRLLLRLITLRMAAAHPDAETGQTDRDDDLPTVRRAFWGALRARCRDYDEYRTACVLLTGLAFAPGAGLPRARGLWPSVVSRALDPGTRLTDHEVRRVLEIAAPLLAEGLDARGRSVYRLQHEEYAQVLRETAKAGTAKRVKEALIEERVEREKDGESLPGYPILPDPTEPGQEPGSDAGPREGLTQMIVNAVSARAHEALSWFIDRYPSQWRGFPEVYFIGAPRGTVLQGQANLQGGQEVTVYAPKGGSLYIRRVTRTR
ncbi:UNVERIFIED_CONTAM: hypothetical protein RKD50_006473 [Streptomyces canus]|jgi:hypothetical protein